MGLVPELLYVHGSQTGEGKLPSMFWWGMCGLDLGHGAQQCLWGKESQILLFLRGRRQAQSFPSYPYQVCRHLILVLLITYTLVLLVTYSMWWGSLRDVSEPRVRWLHAGSMYPAQRPVLGHGGSWGCSRSNANFGCYHVTLGWSTWFFYHWEICFIPQSNWSTANQNNFPLNKGCATTILKK